MEAGSHQAGPRFPDLTDAACAGATTELFYAHERPGPKGKKVESYDQSPRMTARIFCQHCPVLAECAEWGIANEEHGIWGGLTEAQRRVIRRERGGRRATG